MAKYLLLNSVILPDFSTFDWYRLRGEGQSATDGFEPL